jgi:hypothetical protein
MVRITIYNRYQCIANLAIVVMTVLKPLTFNYSIRNDKVTLKNMYVMMKCKNNKPSVVVCYNLNSSVV